jgi:hypothetical protein
MSPGAPQNPYQQSSPRYPGVVMAAGIIWIVFGSLILLNGAGALLLGAAMSAGTGSGGALGAGASIGVVAALFGAAFLFVGVQSVRGTAPGTLGNGIGSIVFAVLQFGGGVAQVVAGQPLLGAINFLGGCGLLAAGVLALIGRTDYMAWRKARPR